MRLFREMPPVMDVSSQGLIRPQARTGRISSHSRSSGHTAGYEWYAPGTGSYG